jgi:hypothetical protein
MQGRQLGFNASGNPLIQIVSLLALGIVIVGAVIMGAFVLLAFLGVAAVGFIVLAVRGWWLRRKLRGGGPRGDGPGRPAKGVRYIEGEYEVLDADADAERRRSGKRS